VFGSQLRRSKADGDKRHNQRAALLSQRQGCTPGPTSGAEAQPRVDARFDGDARNTLLTVCTFTAL